MSAHDRREDCRVAAGSLARGTKATTANIKQAESAIMKTRQMLFVVLGAFVLCLAAQTAQAFYNPQTGRWLTRDPIVEKGGLNLYGSVKNDPIDFWDKLGQKCCLRTYHPGNGSVAGHSVLSCGENNEIYVSLFPGDNSCHGAISKPGNWHTPDDDKNAYPNNTPTEVCFDCLDENKVRDWLAKAKAGSMNWNLGNECADVTSQAIAAGLGDQKKPKCPCPPSADKRWVVEDLLKPEVGITMPTQMDSNVQQMANGGCNRFRCVLKDTYHGRIVN